MDLITAAQSYQRRGFYPLPLNNKVPLEHWRKSENEEDPINAFKRQNGKANGCGLRCGDGLEAIDCDIKNDLSGTLKEDLLNRIKECIPDLYERLHITSTPSGGIHILYECEKIQGNQKLASRPATEAEKGIKSVVLIETRGEGGVIATYPTPGYELIQSQPITKITVEERDSLLNICRSFNQVYEVKNITPPKEFNKETPFELSPWEDFNQRGDIEALLSSHGWRKCGETAERIFFTRPGKVTGVSADYHKALRLLTVHSTSTEFEPQHAYTLTKVYSILRFNGDSSQTCKELERQGYGIRKQLDKIPDNTTVVPFLG
jgi:hypothetical protein